MDDDSGQKYALTKRGDDEIDESISAIEEDRIGCATASQKAVVVVSTVDDIQKQVNRSRFDGRVYTEVMYLSISSTPQKAPKKET